MLSMIKGLGGGGNFAYGLHILSSSWTRLRVAGVCWGLWERRCSLLHYSLRCWPTAGHRQRRHHRHLQTLEQHLPPGQTDSILRACMRLTTVSVRGPTFFRIYRCNMNLGGGSVADWLVCWTQPRRCRVTVSGKLFTPIVLLFTKQRNW